MTGQDTQPVAVLRAEALLDADRPEDALRELATLSGADVGEAYPYELRARALCRLERYDEMAEAARQGLEVGGPDPDLLYYLAVARFNEHYSIDAEHYILDGLALAPDDIDLLCAYAKMCLKHRQVDKARRLADLAAQEDPDAPIVYETRILVAHAAHDDRRALRLSQEFAAAHPEDPQAHLMLGRMSAARGEVRAAYSGMRQAVALDPGDADYAKAAIDARIDAHPLLAPLRPIIRFGWVRSWICVIVLCYGLGTAGLNQVAVPLVLGWLMLCGYAWFVRRVVRRRARRRR